MIVPAYNVARLVEYLTRYRLNGATVSAKDGAWSIVRPQTDRDPDYTAITIRRDGNAAVYFGDARSCIDAAAEVKCGICTNAIDAERMILNALDTLAHDVYAQARADREAMAQACRKCGRTDDLHVQDGIAECHPCMLDADLARHIADQKRRAREKHYAQTCPTCGATGEYCDADADQACTFPAFTG